MDNNTLATQNDIAQLKAELAREFKGLLQGAFGNMPTKRWLKLADLKKILGISNGFLQALRDDGTLPFIKIGGSIYFDYQDIIQMMATNKNTYGQ